MAYDEKKDKTIKEWEINNTTDTLKACVKSYNDGPMKFQLGPRVRHDAGGIMFMKVGRLSPGETVWLAQVCIEACDIMKNEKGVIGER